MQACIDAGVPMLCEKPLTTDATQAAAMLNLARERGVFCAMEAMWTRFLPAVTTAREWVRTGRIGEPRLLEASFGFRAGWDPNHRLLAPALAGGGILDVGVYPIALAIDIFGTAPSRVVAVGHIGESGVDEQAAIGIQFAGRATGQHDLRRRTSTHHSVPSATALRAALPWRVHSGARPVLRLEINGETDRGRLSKPIAATGMNTRRQCREQSPMAGPGTLLLHTADTVACLNVSDQARRHSSSA